MKDYKSFSCIRGTNFWIGDFDPLGDGGRRCIINKRDTISWSYTKEKKQQKMSDYVMVFNIYQYYSKLGLFYYTLLEEWVPFLKQLRWYIIIKKKTHLQEISHLKKIPAVKAMKDKLISNFFLDPRILER